MRSSRSLPRKSSRRNPAPCHSASRADSATCREWSMSSFVWTFAMVPSNRTRPRGRAAADFVIKLTRCGLLRSAVTREGRAPARCARQLRGYRTRTRGGPMIGPKMQQALNRHVQAETSSSYLYLAMSAWAEAKAWKGFARWLRVQSDEEVLHARKTLDFLLARGGEARLGAIDAPPASWASVNEVFEKVLEHERNVTALVNDLSALAHEEKDRAAEILLQWFVSEQVEEEARVVEIVDRLRMVGDRPGAAIYLDKEYGKRGRTAG